MHCDIEELFRNELGDLFVTIEFLEVGLEQKFVIHLSNHFYVSG